MNTNTWLLGAVLFAVLGIHAAMTTNGVWYMIVSAVIHFVASACFARAAYVSYRRPELDT